jgi:rare lipoprotein A
VTFLRAAIVSALASITILGFAVGFIFWTVPARGGETVCGKASWYGNEHHGRRTASGEVFNQWAMTAAMPSRKHLGERWRVTYNGKSVVVRINDLGPHRRLNRIIDLSMESARQIGLLSEGVATVCIEKLSAR